MANLTVIAEGTQTAVIGTEHTLVTDTSNCTYVCKIDTGAMLDAATPDILELRIYDIVRSAGTERLGYLVSYVGSQASPIKYSVPVSADISIKFTLKQVQGTGRAYPWKLLEI
jgi:hypothetical protein